MWLATYTCRRMLLLAWRAVLPRLLLLLLILLLLLLHRRALHRAACR